MLYHFIKLGVTDFSNLKKKILILLVYYLSFHPPHCNTWKLYLSMMSVQTQCQLNICHFDSLAQHIITTVNTLNLTQACIKPSKYIIQFRFIGVLDYVLCVTIVNILMATRVCVCHNRWTSGDCYTVSEVPNMAEDWQVPCFSDWLIQV